MDVTVEGSYVLIAKMSPLLYDLVIDTAKKSTSHGMASYPLYHTQYETFDMVKNFIDVNFEAHEAIARMIASLTLRLSQTSLLPFNPVGYYRALSNVLKNTMNNISIEANFTNLQNAVEDFKRIAEKFNARVTNIDKKKYTQVIDLRMNDQLLQLERAFINPLGNSVDRPDLKHIVYGPSRNNKYGAKGFPVIADSIEDRNLDNIRREIAYVTYFVRSAISVLQETTIFQTTA
ncbi:unnamed protein product [Didymodactylos carnosus]|uniref:Transferrin receptor-like dimerisation domain-containing protein n=1 Tax=Didymodactylos carnosus TaxID=1234261 RepID=A0A814KIZ0_9BILA|nr:unnamed protein product [Didymodactylos carnosus]CAF1050122.1 unnamed protein product [Didymodactylos carnosus]CAF3657918.1 unnamed protein product [Didymodactylos carnosus]CAF3819751.1 unnamed protein product [Didymodactylos carnosus]